MNKNKEKLVKELTDEFKKEFTQLSITVLPNNDIVYEDFLIKQSNGSWDLFNRSNRDKLSTFFLRSCALLAAKKYKDWLFNEYREIKQLDRDYKRNFINSKIHRHNLTQTTDDDTKVILLNQLECVEADAEYYKRKISCLFKRSFV